MWIAHLTRKERGEDEASLCKDNGKEYGIGRLAVLGNDSTQVLVQVQYEVCQPCIATCGEWPQKCSTCGCGYVSAEWASVCSHLAMNYLE